MAEKKKEEMMSPVQEKTGKTEVLTIGEKKQPIKVLNLETNEEESIPLVLKTYKLNDKAAVGDQLKALSALVTPESEKVKAFVKFLESKTYQDAKDAALGKGNYLTQQLRTAIVTILSNYPSMQELSAKEVFDRWLQGYKTGKASAKTILDQAKAATGDNIDL